MRARDVAAVVVCLVVAGACATTPERAKGTTTEATAPDETTTTRAETTTTSTPSLPEVAPIAWRSCGGGFDCATVVVPVDYRDPAAGTLELAAIRRPASDPARRIGSLVMNPGGPGASGVRRVRRGFTVSPEVAARFDIVGFDPRGVGGSTPVRCGGTVARFRAVDLDPDTPEEGAALAAAAEAVAEECARTEGTRLAHLGTAEVVLDLEMLRRAIGEPQISFVGLSYGTLLGQLWADAFPESVRAMVLDGVVDPAADDGDGAGEQAAGVDDALASIDRACAASPGCPVRDAGGVLAAYDELARRLDAGGAVGSVGPTQLAYAAFSATYDERRWPQLWTALRRGLDGDLQPVADMARWFTNLVSYAPYAIVTCLDAPHATGFDAWQASAAELAAQSPRFGRIIANELLPCAWWPPATLEPRPIQAIGAAPILVIGSTGDAATPYAQAVRVAQRLRSGVLLTVEQDGHLALGDSACADAAVTRYLVDLALPEPGTVC